MSAVVVKIKGVNCEGKDWIIPSDVNFRLVLVQWPVSTGAIRASIHMYTRS